MKLTVNGEPRDTRATTVAELVQEMGLAGHAVAVELNQQVVPKKEHAHTKLHEGDTLELVTLVGGG